MKRRKVGTRPQWVEQRSAYHYTVSVLPPGRERVEPAEDIDRMARPVTVGEQRAQSECDGCGMVLAWHEYTDHSAYRITYLHPELRPRPARHPNGLRYFGPEARVERGKTPRGKQQPTAVTGMLYAECPRCRISQAVFAAPVI